MWILGVQVGGCLQLVAFNAAFENELASSAGDRFVRLGGCVPAVIKVLLAMDSSQ